MFENMSPEAMRAWGLLTQAYPDLGVTSTYRSPEHNARVGGAKHSQHTHGNAFDINTAGWDEARRQAFVRAALDAGFTGIGNYDGSMHVDVGPRRVWGPSYGADTAPEWLTALVMNGDAPAYAGGSAGNTQQNQPQNALTTNAQGQEPQNALFRMVDTRQDPRAFQNALNYIAPTLRFDQFMG